MSTVYVTPSKSYPVSHAPRIQYQAVKPNGFDFVRVINSHSIFSDLNKILPIKHQSSFREMVCNEVRPARMYASFPNCTA
jgi:hypothetical protein